MWFGTRILIHTKRYSAFLAASLYFTWMSRDTKCSNVCVCFISGLRTAKTVTCFSYSIEFEFSYNVFQPAFLSGNDVQLPFLPTIPWFWWTSYHVTRFARWRTAAIRMRWRLLKRASLAFRGRWHKFCLVCSKLCNLVIKREVNRYWWQKCSADWFMTTSFF